MQKMKVPIFKLQVSKQIPSFKINDRARSNQAPILEIWTFKL
jgi:hypothetical protein